MVTQDYTKVRVTRGYKYGMEAILTELESEQKLVDAAKSDQLPYLVYDRLLRPKSLS